MASIIHNRYASTSFDWIIKDFSKVNSEEGLRSDVFSVGGFEWQVQVFPKGFREVLDEYLSVFLIPVDSSNLPFAEFSVCILNLLNHNESARHGFKHKFHRDSLYLYGWGLPTFMALSELHHPGKGYIMDDTCVLRVEISCSAIGDDVSGDLKENNPVKAMQLGGHPGAGQPFGEGQNKYTVSFGEDEQEFEDIGGFHILKTQVLLYRMIWLNYGHIPSNRVMPISSYPTLVMVVKDLMSSITDMYKCHYVDLSPEMIETCEDMIKRAENLEFNIVWLRERFEHVKRRMGGMQIVKTQLLEHGQHIRETKSKLRVLRDVMTTIEVKLIEEKDDVRKKISGLLSESDMETYLEIGEDLLLDGLLDGVYI